MSPPGQILYPELLRTSLVPGRMFWCWDGPTNDADATSDRICCAATTPQYRYMAFKATTPTPSADTCIAITAGVLEGQINCFGSPPCPPNRGISRPIVIGPD